MFHSKRAKGDLFEEHLSKDLHTKHTAFLVSSMLLQERNCGQVDIAYLKNGIVYLVEAKNGGELTSAQYFRLKRSGEFLANILDKSIFIKLSFAK